MSENREFFINCDGIEIHSKLDFPKVELGKMPILVLFPGFTGHIEERHIIGIKDAANEVGFVVLRSELYGHGKSGGKFYDHSVLLWMAEAMRVIEYARNLSFISDVYVAGHSQGGLTAVLAAGLMNDIVKAVLPLSPAMNIPYDAKRGSILGVQFDEDNIPKEISSDTWTLSSNYIRAAKMLPINEAISSYKKPVLIIHGNADEAVPYHFGKELSESYENAKLVTIEGDNHCYDYHLDKVLDAIKDFLITLP